jgi:hypothetical protein
MQKHKKFTEWLEENHKDFIDEGWRNWAAGAAAGVGGLLGAAQSHGADARDFLPNSPTKTAEENPAQKFLPNAENPGKRFVTLQKDERWHPYDSLTINGKIVEKPNWEYAKQNMIKYGKTGLKPADQRVFNQYKGNPQ